MGAMRVSEDPDLEEGQGRAAKASQGGASSDVRVKPRARACSRHFGELLQLRYTTVVCRVHNSRPRLLRNRYLLLCSRLAYVLWHPCGMNEGRIQCTRTSSRASMRAPVGQVRVLSLHKMSM